MQYIQSSSLKPVICPAKIRIGTRKSNLALAQANEVKNRLLGAFPELTQDQIELVTFDTMGDLIQDKHLAEIGGKGLFTKELEESLRAGEIDFAVHSMKDMPYELPEGMVADCIVEREDSRDAFVSNISSSIESLPEGAVIGTSSIRRHVQIKKHRPDIKIVQFRGNVNTRLRKLDDGEVDATILAVAGLKRLGKEDRITSIIDKEFMMPAIAQGAICIEYLKANPHIKDVLDKINHEVSRVCITAERSFLTTLEGSCVTPIGGNAYFEEDGKLFFKGFIADIEGKEFYFAERRGTSRDAFKMGQEVGKEILKRMS